ncbi:MAG: helix-turn-helix transcriptional regulator [Ignavibacteria bacterium]|nr:helix-turn-helix transcriptional regulator [Ignavibacteria bacterium]
MKLFLHTPPPPLSDVVELFTYFEGHSPVHSVERLFPEGVVEIIIDLTEIPKHIYDNASLSPIQECRESWVSGVRSSPINISAGGNDSSMFVIRLKPGRSFPVLGIPVSELNGSVISADQLFGRPIAILRERLLEAPTPAGKCRIVEQFLLNRLSGGSTTPEIVRFTVASVLSQPRNSVLRDVLDQSGYSRKHLINLFRNHVGIPPLAFVRLVRFQHALQMISTGGNIDWAGIALDCGYYDQPHFNNDFRRFSGFTPGEFRMIAGGEANYIPVG